MVWIHIILLLAEYYVYLTLGLEVQLIILPPDNDAIWMDSIMINHRIYLAYGQLWEITSGGINAVHGRSWTSQLHWSFATLKMLFICIIILIYNLNGNHAVMNGEASVCLDCHVLQLMVILDIILILPPIS